MLPSSGIGQPGPPLPRPNPHLRNPQQHTQTIVARDTEIAGSQRASQCVAGVARDEEVVLAQGRVGGADPILGELGLGYGEAVRELFEGLAV
mmetsp:Transcript_5481/g.6731  ORF Transcript_5481/g.6731 Transcript_5481/m.6731 type:complete len:92 (-) Transcript_5481:408-683(-)